MQKAHKTFELSALEFLRKDHREVKKIFAAFEELKDKDGSNAEKGRLVQQACDALAVHAQIEEEIFYPAVRQAIKDQDIMDEAEVEHEEAKALISQLVSMKPGENLYDAKFTVLIENVRHHIREEEGEMFPKLGKTRLDFEKLGEELAVRSRELKLERGIFEEEDLATLPKQVHARTSSAR